jgi:hypothetical protein
MSDDYTALVKRAALSVQGRYCELVPGWFLPIDTCRELAAAAITALQAENARLREALKPLADNPCSCGLMHGAMRCLPCHTLQVLKDTTP